MSAAEPSSVRKGNNDSAFKLKAISGVFAKTLLKSLLGWPAKEEPKDSAVVATARKKGSCAGRSLRIGIVILGIVILAIGLANLIVSILTRMAPLGWVKYIQLGTAGVSFSLLIPAVNQIFLTGEKLIKYIREGEPSGLFPEFAKVGTTALALAIAVFSFITPPQQSNLSAAQSATPKELVYLTRLPSSDEAPLEYFPYLFELADGPSNWLVGTTLNKEQKKDLERLVSSLKACVGANLNEDVVIDVRGYADTNEFPSNTKELNRQTANRRAASVYEQLQGLIDSQDGPSRLILLDFFEWPKNDPEAMTRERYFRTKKLRETGANRDQGLFNRRADVLVLRIGVCKQLSSKQP
jgi:hypothetical protein